MRLVVKVGSAVISKEDGGLNRKAVERIGNQLAHLHQNGHDVILVTSGAIAAGVGRLGWKERPSDLRLKQSAAAVGQLTLMEAYEDVFSKANIVPAQILITREDLFHRQRYLNIRNTVMNLLSLRTIPIVNENDCVSTDEIQFGDNDTLSAVVASKVEADRLIILSDVPGLYESGFEKKSKKIVIPVVEKVTVEMEEEMSNAVGSKHSVGGMVTKLKAAKMAAAAGIETWIASGHTEGILDQVMAGQENAGTRFLARKAKFASRHAWIAFGRAPKGILVVDDGAQKALVDKRKSLLPSGIKSIRGEFQVGETVELRSARGAEIARGLVNYNSEDLKEIRGHHTREIESLLGRSSAAEVIHRDNLVLL